MLLFRLNMNVPAELFLLLASALLFLAALLVFLAWSERKRLETKENLWEGGKKPAEEKLNEAIFSSIGEGVIFVNKESKIVFFNNTAEKLLGYLSIEAVGKPFDKIVKFKDSTKQSLGGKANPIAFTLTHGKSFSTSPKVELYQTKKNGEDIPISLSITPVMVDGKLAGTVEVFRDITEQKEFDRLKDEFFSIASHEIKTPLSVIKGNSSILLDYFGDNISKDISEILRDNYEAADKLISMVNSFLNISSLELGRFTFDVKQFNLEETIGRLINYYKTVASSKNIKLIYKKPENELPKIVADPDRVDEILTNLIGNSLKFTEKGKIEIQTILKDNFVETSVSDTGVGIDVKSREQLFKKFQIAEGRVLSRHAGGSGLGLYVSKNLVEKMGGKLYLKESTLDKGSTFVFTLPAVING